MMMELKMPVYHPFPDHKILALSKLEASADIFNSVQIAQYFTNRLGNKLGNGY